MTQRQHQLVENMTCEQTSEQRTPLSRGLGAQEEGHGPTSRKQK